MYCSFHSKNDPSGWIRLDKEVKKVTNLSVRTRASVLLQFRFFVALQVLGLVRTSGFDFLTVCLTIFQKL